MASGRVPNTLITLIISFCIIFSFYVTNLTQRNRQRRITGSIRNFHFALQTPSVRKIETSLPCRKQERRSFLFHFVGQFADAFDFTGDHIAGFQEFRGLKTHTYPSGRTHGNDGACL